MNPRLEPLLGLDPASARDEVGRHRFDGQVADLSPAGVRSLLAALGQGPPEPDHHDEAHLAIGEAAARYRWGTLGWHRHNPLPHLSNLDLSGYDRDYAPPAERAAARRLHLGRWPEAVAASLESLDATPAPVAAALLGSARHLVDGLEPADDPAVAAALAAHGLLMARLEALAQDGPPDVALGAAGLAGLLSASEGMPVDLGRLAALAASEGRWSEVVRECCGRLAPGAAVGEVVAGLDGDHPGVDELYGEASALVAEATAFAQEAGILADPGGTCLVGPAPPPLRWAMAMMSWNGPYEQQAPAWYWVTPDPAWSPQAQADWMAVFSRARLPAITVHEVTPGHFAHGQALRGLRSDVRRTVLSSAFVEGWAHYVEEAFVEAGFRAADPRFALGVALEALVRSTRLAVAIDLHSGSIDLGEATRRFEVNAFLKGRAARAEAERGTYDPSYGRYTWGKAEILRLRDEAEARWGNRYSHLRFHQSILGLGAPPLGLLGAALGGD